MKSLEDILKSHAFFKDLKPGYLKLISGCGSNVHFKAGQYLAREGAEADRFFAIREGTVAVEIHTPDRGAVAVQTVSEGDILGWSWLFPPHRWKFDGRARSEVRATSFDGACLRKKCEADPAMGYELMKRLALLVSQRLEATRLQLMDLYAADTRKP
ncbi:MAG: cyclic nucleotide-binding domain-containing protein [Planctomycetes bacterium]|nr:cyclic nucleotide-binding domain-containing protein [Planctomycetota bacterium]